MGLDKEKRPILAQGGLQVNSASTFTGNIVQSTGSAWIEHIQSLTGASTGTAVTNYGLTKIVVLTSTEGTAANLVYTLTAPGAAGKRKAIVVDNNSTKTVEVRTPSSAAASNFFGSTKNAVLWSTGSTDLPARVSLISASSLQWIVMDISSTSIAVQGSTA